MNIQLIKSASGTFFI